MGLNYSLCLIAKREDTDSVLEHLCTLLDSDSRDRIPSRKWTPESEKKRTTMIGTTETDARGIVGINLSDHESSNSYCLSLHVQLEREFEPLLHGHRLDCFEHRGSFGCMWTSIFAGDQYVLLEMTAATSAMSEVLRHSEAIHQIWTDLSMKTDAIFAYVDLEERMALQLFPLYGDLTLPDQQTLAFDDDARFSVDRWVKFLLSTNSR